ncbi:ABC transporter permease subunit [Neobacillus cucumis]|uniref:ABC transporter permease subunit n=1 Tax=Neobacillus cucumis TaxID=1740721 RepID=UPI0019634A1E|nr:ABC transporter permease subunit [Neobacillus cucumis]MBM7653908.1 ABC-2 type transport system permease protein [Neobacillus cucumis]
MNIFFHELKAYRKSTLIWTFSLIMVALLFLSMYPSFAKDADEFKKLLAGYPLAMRKAIGLNLENIFTILGFYSYALTFTTICAAIQAMNLGTGIVSKEVREKTADFLLTKPVTRTQILTSKLLAAFTSLLFTNIVYQIAVTFIAFQVKTEEYSVKKLMLLSLTMFFIQLIFLSIGIIISVIVPKIKSVLTVSLATVFAFYFLGVISETSGDDVKRYISPFKYFDHIYIMKHANYEEPFLIVGAIMVVAAIVASYFIYAKRDIHAV